MTGRHAQLLGAPEDPAPYAPRHRRCMLHPEHGDPGVWWHADFPDAQCDDTCWTRRGRLCLYGLGHRPGYDVPSGRRRFCLCCLRTRDVCCEDHCLDCGTGT